MSTTKISDNHHPIARLFGAGLVERFEDPLFEASLKTLLYESGIYPESLNWTLEKALQLAYKHLKKNYRCEYVYKNEIANQLLLKRHKNNSATLLTEFNINRSIADIVIVNGTTSVYEIKTELDSMDRLIGQINDYSQVIEHISVVTHPAGIKRITKMVPSYVGILVMDNLGRLIEERASGKNEGPFNHWTAGRILRQGELIKAYIENEGPLPTVGTAYIGSTCRHWFSKIETDLAKLIFKDSLKSRRPSTTQFNLIKQAPRELKISLLSKQVPKKICIKISDKLNIVL